MSKKSFDPYKLKKQNKIQTGRGLYGRFRGSYLIPVNPNSTQTESTLIQNKLVAPVEADAERAESELKENNSKKKPHVKILKSIKVEKRKNIVRKKKGVTKKSSKKKERDEQNSQLQSQLFMKDDDPMNSLSLNSGYVSRYEYTKESRIFELEGKSVRRFSFVGQIFDKWSRYIFKIIRSSTPFLLMSGESNPNYQVKIVDVFYRTCRCKPDPGVIINHRNLLREDPAKYLINRSHVTQNVIQKGVTEFYWDSIFPKVLPDKVVFGLLPQKAVNGDYTINPFDFKHFNMESVSLKINGVDVYGSPMKLDFGTNRNYTAAYVRLFEICEKWNKDTGLNISLFDFGKGYTFIAFTLNPNDFQDEFFKSCEKRKC
ncbi:unnamed protein product [Mytilus coruscus]|uniref:Uncharacterized protein n=1 Tax=Mytilus coruscus TaxID=42192 RepID=A0A6J8F0J2_MYTCO|nr:unnamed protein product [Mytilus coruscus]